VFKSSSTFKCCCGLSDFEVSVSLLHSLVMVLLHNLHNVQWWIYIYTPIQLLTTSVTTLPFEQSHLLVRLEWASTSMNEGPQMAREYSPTWWVVGGEVLCSPTYTHTHLHTHTPTYTHTHKRVQSNMVIITVTNYFSKYCIDYNYNY